MTTRRNFLKTGSISLAGLLVGEKVYSAVSTPDNKKSFSTIASKVTGDYASKRPAPEVYLQGGRGATEGFQGPYQGPEAGLDVRELLPEYLGHDL